MNGYVVIGLRAAVRALTGSVEDPGVATDLISGERVILRRGCAVDAAYASAAIAGIVPPLARGPALLADGGYADIAPVDVARSIDTLDFTATRSCVAAGTNAVRASLHELRRLLDPDSSASTANPAAGEGVAACPH